MPRPKIMPDEDLIAMFATGSTQSEIAQYFNVSRNAVSVRLKELEKKETLRRQIDPAVNVLSIWDIQAAARENYRRVSAMLNDNSLSNMERIRIAREIRQQHEFSLKVIEPLCAAQMTEKFLGGIMAIVKEIAPSDYEKIRERVREEFSCGGA